MLASEESSLLSPRITPCPWNVPAPPPIGIGVLSGVASVNVIPGIIVGISVPGIVVGVVVPGNVVGVVEVAPGTVVMDFWLGGAPAGQNVTV